MMEVVVLIAEGLSIKEIAFVLHIKSKTVEYHWAMARSKLRLQTHVDACKFALRNGLIKL